MTALTLKQANLIINTATHVARELNLAPLTIVVLDNAGHVKALQREDGASEDAHGEGRRYGKGFEAEVGELEEEEHEPPIRLLVLGCALPHADDALGARLVSAQEREVRSEELGRGNEFGQQTD